MFSILANIPDKPDGEGRTKLTRLLFSVDHIYFPESTSKKLHLIVSRKNKCGIPLWRFDNHVSKNNYTLIANEKSTYIKIAMENEPL